MSELFPPEEVQSMSPRLLWMVEHGIRTMINRRGDVEPWEAFVGDRTTAIEDTASNAHFSKLIQWGASEDYALYKLAVINGWPLWNEKPWNQ